MPEPITCQMDKYIGFRPILVRSFEYSPIRSYRYTVAMFPLPYKNVLTYRTRQNVGGIPILASNTKCTRECRPHFAACGNPDRAIHPASSNPNPQKGNKDKGKRITLRPGRAIPYTYNDRMRCMSIQSMMHVNANTPQAARRS
jgi:hypothetical protein